MSKLVAKSFSAAAALLAALVTVVGGALEPDHSLRFGFLLFLGWCEPAEEQRATA